MIQIAQSVADVEIEKTHRLIALAKSSMQNIPLALSEEIAKVEIAEKTLKGTEN